MANKYVASSVTRELQMKTLMSLYFICLAKINETELSWGMKTHGSFNWFIHSREQMGNT